MKEVSECREYYNPRSRKVGMLCEMYMNVNTDRRQRGRQTPTDSTDRSDAVGVEPLDSLTAGSERRTPSKLQAIMDDGSHPAYDTAMRHRSSFSARLTLPK
ncbi:hypothetical protein AOLI_G00196180 [Acnodon oligacanthus]